MSENREQVSVHLGRLRRDRSLQVRQTLNGSHIERLCGAYKSGREVDPITVAEIGGEAVLVDGWHRVEAMLRLAMTTADAWVIRTTEREARWLAASANLSHGIPLKKRELRLVFHAFIQARKHRKSRPKGQATGHPGDNLMSYREIAPHIGVTYGTIRNWMRKDFPKVAAQMAGDEEFKGHGGLVEVQQETSGGSARDTIGAIELLMSAFREETDPDMRGALIEMVERVAREMKEHGNWRASDF